MSVQFPSINFDPSNFQTITVVTAPTVTEPISSVAQNLLRKKDQVVSISRKTSKEPCRCRLTAPEFQEALKEKIDLKLDKKPYSLFKKIPRDEFYRLVLTDGRRNYEHILYKLIEYFPERADDLEGLAEVTNVFQKLKQSLVDFASLIEKESAFFQIISSSIENQKPTFNLRKIVQFKSDEQERLTKNICKSQITVSSPLQNISFEEIWSLIISGPKSKVGSKEFIRHQLHSLNLEMQNIENGLSIILDLRKLSQRIVEITMPGFPEQIGTFLTKSNGETPTPNELYRTVSAQTYSYNF